MTLNNIITDLRTHLDEERFIHSLNVMNTAAELAKIYNEDIKKSKIAGILHDCGKNTNEGNILKLVKEIGYKPDDIEACHPALLHGLIGSWIARERYGIEDEDILNAIRWHTTGRADMSLLEKIIYVADYIEPNRKFKGVEEIRKVAFLDIDRSIVLCADFSIKRILEKGFLLHINSVRVRNNIIAKKLIR